MVHRMDTTMDLWWMSWLVPMDVAPKDQRISSFQEAMEMMSMDCPTSFLYITAYNQWGEIIIFYLFLFLVDDRLFFFFNFVYQPCISNSGFVVRAGLLWRVNKGDGFGYILSMSANRSKWSFQALSASKGFAASVYPI